MIQVVPVIPGVALDCIVCNFLGKVFCVISETADTEGDFML